jgi:hypothetical protein
MTSGLSTLRPSGRVDYRPKQRSPGTSQSEFDRPPGADDKPTSAVASPPLAHPSRLVSSHA